MAKINVKEIMERANIKQTGRAIAYIKDALDEIQLISPTHIKSERIDIAKNERFYPVPSEAIKILDIRCKHYNNTDDKHRSIPRAMHEPQIVDDDGK